MVEMGSDPPALVEMHLSHAEDPPGRAASGRQEGELPAQVADLPGDRPVGHDEARLSYVLEHLLEDPAHRRQPPYVVEGVAEPHIGRAEGLEPVEAVRGQLFEEGHVSLDCIVDDRHHCGTKRRVTAKASGAGRQRRTLSR